MAARSGLDDFKAAIYACPNHTDDDIHSDHGYLDTCYNPLGPPKGDIGLAHKGSLAPCFVAVWSLDGLLETPPCWHKTIAFYIACQLQSLDFSRNP